MTAKADNTNIEKWRDIEGYEGDYLISSLGRVMSTIGKPKIRKLKTNPQGYWRIRLQGKGGDKTFFVHRLVCAAFHGPRPSEYHMVAHNDGTKDNNVPHNLRWATGSENACDRSLHGTAAIGEKNTSSKLRSADILVIRQKYKDGSTLMKIAKEYGVSANTISSVVRGLSWSFIK